MKSHTSILSRLLLMPAMVIFSLSILLPDTASAQPVSWIPGDANNDGQVDSIDALLIAQNYVGINVVGIFMLNSDVDGDLEITVIDALLVAQFFVGLIDEFPVETDSYEFQDPVVRSAVIQALDKAPEDDITKWE